MTDPSSTIGSRIAEKSGWREISGPLFRKYVALFLAVVCVALLSNGVFEIWFSYQEHRAWPGGNLTGTANIGNILLPKLLEVLHELVPAADSIAFLVNPNNPITESDTKNLQAAAGTTGQQILTVKASSVSEIDVAFTTLVQRHTGALLVQLDPLFNSRRDQIAVLAIGRGVPGAASYREFVSSGGLMSYGSNPEDSRRLQGNYVGRVLKGEKPADLPVIQATKFDLVLNLNTAKALGLTVPPSLLAIADEVIE